MKKSASYSPLKGDISRKGLSQIMQQSYKDELENSKYQLAKLSNEQFLSRYIHLNNHMSAINQYKYLLQTPISQIYQRFQFNDLPKEENAAGLIKKAIQDGIKRSFAVLSKEDLKALASKKIGQAVQQERLSTSRKQKKEQLYDKLKSSRRREDKVNQDSPVRKLQKAESFIETIKKDASTEQPIQDIFMRLQPYGETRDYIKKKWYSWGQKGDLQQRKTIIEQWRENHKNLKYLLELLLQKLKVIYGSHHVYTFLNSPAKTSIIESPNTKKSRRSEQQRTSTSRIEKQLKQQDSKVIYRFSSWFNKILLDERQLEYIQSSKTLKSSQKKKPLNEETVYIDSPSKK